MQDGVGCPGIISVQVSIAGTGTQFVPFHKYVQGQQQTTLLEPDEELLELLDELDDKLELLELLELELLDELLETLEELELLEDDELDDGLDDELDELELELDELELGFSQHNIVGMITHSTY